MTDLTLLLDAAFVLSGATKTPTTAETKDLKGVIAERLDRAYEILGASLGERSGNVVAERGTALCALSILERIQHIFDEDEARLIGTRDLAQLRTLLSIVFKWYIDQETSRLCSHLEQRFSSEVDAMRLQVELASGVYRLWQFIFPPQASAKSASSASTSSQGAARTHITQTLIARHLPGLFRPTLLLLSISPGLTETLQSINAHLETLIRLLPASESITALGSIMASAPGTPGTPAVPDSTRQLCSNMLSAQLLREDGVIGLFSAMFGEGESAEDAPISKLEHAAQLLITPPDSMEKDEYYRLIIPRLISILAPTLSLSKTPSSTSLAPTPTAAPLSHRRAASFTISRMMSRRATAEVITPIIRSILCAPFLSPSPSPLIPISSPPSTSFPTSTSSKTVTEAISILTTLLVNADPSPVMIHFLISPIIVPLYALSSFLDIRRGIILKEPALRELANGLVMTWARILRPADAVKGWWAVIEGRGGWGLDGENQDLDGKEWDVSEGEVFIRTRTPDSVRLPTLTSRAEDLSSEEVGLNLYPDPARLVQTLQDLNKKDVSGAIFIRCLDEYNARSQTAGSPLRTMLYLNIILEMIEKLDSSILSSDVQHLLRFVAHALEPKADHPQKPKSDPSSKSKKSVISPNSLSLDDLRIVDSDDDDDDEDATLEEMGDSDDEDEELQEGDVPMDEEESILSSSSMTFTALNLLLAILEGNPEIAPSSTPLLRIITSHLEALKRSRSSSIRKTALEAQLVLAAREASGAASKLSTPQRRTDLEVYQEALKLIQDPILPVRAHGLLMLRQLVVPPRASSSKKEDDKGKQDVDPALVPAILDVFMQSIQDDDSFVFLNAVQGLSAMVDKLGRSILIRLMGVYTGGEGAAGVTMTKGELDKKLRIGEALGQIVKRCGDTLPAYADVLAPGLLHTFRSSYCPANLRSSALSILAACMDVSTVALLPWTEELISGMIDLLQVETVSFSVSQKTPAAASSTPANGENEEKPRIDRHTGEDAVPALTTSTKAPTLRRSALHFLSLLLRAFVQQAYDSIPSSDNPSSLSGFDLRTSQHRSTSEPNTSTLPALNVEGMRRVGTVVRYVRDTDVDGVVRAQAEECVELLEQLMEATMGI